MKGGPAQQSPMNGAAARQPCSQGFPLAARAGRGTLAGWVGPRFSRTSTAHADPAQPLPEIPPAVAGPDGVHGLDADRRLPPPRRGLLVLGDPGPAGAGVVGLLLRRQTARPARAQPGRAVPA